VKKIIFCVVIAVALCAPPTLVGAQLLPGLPGLPGMPSLNLPSNVTLGNLSIYGGWATNAGMTHYVLSKGDAVVTGIGQAEWDYKYSSFYTAAMLPLSIGDYSAVLLSGSLAIPSSSPAREKLHRDTGVFEATRRWNADTYWATLEGIWAYPLSGTFTALAGFRWECWQTSYKSPVNEYALGPLLAPTDSADVTVNGYIPFVGLMVTYGHLNLGAVGIPTTIGEVEHNESFNNGGLRGMEVKGTFTGGYFFEMFADYALPLPGGLGPGIDAELSLFGKCSFLEVEATPTLRWTGSLPGEEDYDFSLHRNLFVVGAKATLKFNLAGILPF
jgi:hypothetical protein